MLTNNTLGTNNGVYDAAQANNGSSEGGLFFGGIDSKLVGNGTLTYAMRIEGNTVRDFNGAAAMLFRSNTQDAAGLGRFEATIRNNSIDDPDPGLPWGLYAQYGGSAVSGDSGQLGLDVISNNIDLSGSTALDAMVIDQVSADADFYLVGYPDAPKPDPAKLSTHLKTTKANTMLNGSGATIPPHVVYPNCLAVGGGTLFLPVP